MGEHPLPARRCGALARPDGSVCWRVWAPRAGQVELLLIHGHQRQVFPMETEGRGYYTLTLPDVREGQRYAYRLGGAERPDPCSLWQPDGVHRASAVVRPGRFAWNDRGWKGVPLEGL